MKQYRYYDYYKGMGQGRYKDMGQVHGERVLGRDMWQGYGISAWNKGIGQVNGTRARDKAGTRTWDKCMGKVHGVGTCGKRMG